jgi:hypothetical protein
MLVSLAVLLLAGLGLAVNALSVPTKPDLSMQISPASQTVTRGQNATFTVSVTPVNGFTGTVSLTASGLPANATASFSPTTVNISNASTQTSTLTVATTSTTPVGTVNITVTGTSGKVSSSVTAGLTVNYQLSGSITLSSSPSTSTINPGATAVYSLTLTRNNMGNNAVALTVASGLPSGASATFSPASTTGTTSSLQVATTSAINNGSYTIYLVASGKDINSTTQNAYASVSLVLSTSGKPFTISSGSIGALAPGVSRPINLTMTNSNNSPIAISNLSVTVQSVTKATGVTKSCATADYAVTQYSGPYPLTVAKNGSASLASLGVAESQWPQLRMLDTNANQDGCKGATLTLAYTGSGSGS